MIKKINTILQNDKPANLTLCLEHFVALLRNKSNTTSEDVELFFKDTAKLVTKMKKTDTTSCSLSIVLAAKGVMDQIRNAFMEAGSGPNDISQFSCFVEWSTNFCEAAKIDLKVFELEKELKKLEDAHALASLAEFRYAQIQKDAEELYFDGYYN